MGASSGISRSFRPCQARFLGLGWFYVNVDIYFNQFLQRTQYVVDFSCFITGRCTNTARHNTLYENNTHAYTYTCVCVSAFLPAQLDDRQDLIPSATKLENVRLTTSANCGSNIQCLFPIIGQCTTSRSVSAVISRDRFGTVAYSLPLVPDCLYDLRAVFSVSSSANPS